MLTPEEKAKELFDKMTFSKSTGINYHTGKVEPIPQNIYALQCALITVNEIQKLSCIEYNNNTNDSQYDYWEEVKNNLNHVL